MRHLLFLALVTGLLVLSGGVAPKTGKALAAHYHETANEMAVVEFNTQVKLCGALLRGKYLVIHDHEKMMQGEDCTYVYTINDGKQDKLIVSFHCTPQARPVAKEFTIKTVRRGMQGMLFEVTELLFAGSSESHLVPRG